MKNKYTIKRHLENKINSLLGQFKCLVLTGPRQVGKSTLLKAILSNTHNFNYVKLDNPSNKSHAINDPEDFLRQYRCPLFIDEIQKAPVLFEYMKDIIDESNSLGQFVVTSSESFELIKGVKEFLSTRAVLVEMNSLSQSEINEQPNFMYVPNPELIRKRRQPAKDKKQIFASIIKGSMPDIINGNVKDVQSYYKTYSRTTLLVDIKEDLIKIQDNKKYEKFLKALASLVGQEINYSLIAKFADIDYKTAMNWTNALASMNVIFLLQPYTHNHLKRVLKSSKLYFYDTGLVCYLMNYRDPEILMNSEYAGHIFECYTISEIVKGYVNECIIPTIYYLQDPNHKNKEIDLIIEAENGVLLPIEVKMSVTPKEKFFSNFSLLRPLKNRVGPTSVICCSENFVSFGEDRYIVPVHWL